MDSISTSTQTYAHLFTNVVTNMADACETPTTRHPLFYYEHGTTIFQVEFTLYKLYHPILVEESQVFAGLFGYGSDAIPNEGKTDKNPIFLPNLTTEVFDMFVQFKFGQ